jgi:hypothetical protein
LLINSKYNRHTLYEARNILYCVEWQQLFHSIWLISNCVNLSNWFIKSEKCPFVVYLLQAHFQIDVYLCILNKLFNKKSLVVCLVSCWVYFICRCVVGIFTGSVLRTFPCFVKLFSDIWMLTKTAKLKMLQTWFDFAYPKTTILHTESQCTWQILTNVIKSESSVKIYYKTRFSVRN